MEAGNQYFFDEEALHILCIRTSDATVISRASTFRVMTRARMTAALSLI